MKVFHGEVDAVSVSVRYFEVTRPCGTRAYHYGIVLRANYVDVNVLSNVCIRNKCLKDELVNRDDVVCPYSRTLTTPSAAIRSTRRCTIALSSFMLNHMSLRVKC